MGESKSSAGERLYLIDGHYLIYRAYHAPFRELTSPAGEPTRATYVFSQQLLKLILEHRPDALAMAVDGPVEKLRRRRIDPEYKANRPPMPEDMPPQVQRIRQIVESLGVPILEVEGYEADDVIATLAARYAGPEREVVIVSRDKDLDQLVGEHVRLYDPMKDEFLGPGELAAAKGFSPAQAVEVQALTGDSSDNVPGVPGIGAKTAAKLIEQYGSAEAVLAHADEQTPKRRENLNACAEQVRRARELVELDAEVPLEADLDAMRLAGIRCEAVRPIFRELGFTRLLERLDGLDERDLDADGRTARMPESSLAAPPDAPRITTAGDLRTVLADTPETLEQAVAALTGCERLSVDTETTATDPMRAELVGLCLSGEPGTGCYIPVRGPMGSRVLEIETVREALRPLLEDAGIEKVAQNLKYDLLVLRRHGFELAGPRFDTMIAAYVLDASRGSYSLDALAIDVLGHRCIPTRDLLGTGKKQITMDTVAVDVVAQYGAEDAEVTGRLRDVFKPRLAEQGLEELFHEIEMPLVSVLAEMEHTGIRVDPAELKRIEQEFSREAESLRERILELGGRAFNPDSPVQLREILFEDLQLPVIKRTKTGASTDSDVLETLAAEHELPATLLEYRKLTKLLNTYLKGLAACIHPRTHRVHTSFNQTATVTGRLSSSGPNLQNIPVRTEQGRRIRAAFVAEEGMRLLAADYSQVELRVLAHFCKDPTLLRAFEDDRDIHRIVAAEVFSVADGDVSAEQRSRAKTVNFGIVYGQTAFGLARTLRIPQAEAAEFIRAYKARFPKIDEFLQACVATARENGYVQTILGRRRTIEGLDSRNPSQRAAAERLAINSVVQGSAADLIKRAMLNLHRRIERDRLPLKMLLQIHDELVFELPEGSEDACGEAVVEEMTGAIELRVPLKVDVGLGANWLEAK